MYIYIQMCAFVCVVVFLSVFIYVHFCFTFLSRYFTSFETPELELELDHMHTYMY